MTRFARAKGSKSSNERTPESATSWQEMKQNVGKNKARKNAEETVKPAKSPVKLGEPERNVKWSEFPDMTPKMKKAGGDKTPKKKKHLESPATKEESSIIAANEDGGSKLAKKLSKRDSSPKKANKKQAVTDEASNEDQTELADTNTKANKTPKRKSMENPEGAGAKKFKQFTPSNKGKFDASARKDPGGNNKQFKKRDLEYKRRKPHSNESTKMFINGIEIEIAYFGGFPVKKADAERLRQLKKDMTSKGVPQSEIAIALKLERRKAEKALAREKKKVCFNCRNSGHTLSECPQLKDQSNSEDFGTGICFKCGSTEHTHFECKVQRGDNYSFAHCFICKEQGHIARQCPDNSRGLYPKGGACRVCGDVTHLKKDCPKYQAEQEEQKIVVDTINSQDIESLESEGAKVNKKSRKSNKVVKF